MSLSNLPYFQDLRAASWRGVPFGVASAKHSIGRKNAIHQYPYVDGVYIEDLGQSGRKYHIQGFLIEGGGAYGGAGSLKAQVQQLDAACLQPGDASFVHPLLGAIAKTALIEYECATDLRGRYAEITFSFIENNAQPTPSVLIDTTSATIAAATTANAATLSDFLATVHGIVRGAVAQVEGVVNVYTTAVKSALFESTSLVSLVATLPGNIGRMVGQNVASALKLPSTTIQSLIGGSSASQSSVLDAIDDLSASSVSGDVSGIGDGIQSVTVALAAANPDPAQAISSMQTLIAASPSDALAASAGYAACNATTDLARRAAAVAMATASATYQPISYNDAESVRSTVCAALSSEMEIAGDAGLDTTYNALRDLKIAVSQDLTKRGASLAKTITVTSAQPLSSLVWAQWLYQDSSREDEIVQDGQPIHPAFMPVKFQALAN